MKQDQTKQKKKKKKALSYHFVIGHHITLAWPTSLLVMQVTVYSSRTVKSYDTWFRYSAKLPILALGVGQFHHQSRWIEQS